MRQFYGSLEKCVLSAGKPVSIKFLVLRGGGVLGLGGGGSADFIFMGAGIFLISDNAALFNGWGSRPLPRLNLASPYIFVGLHVSVAC